MEAVISLWGFLLQYLQLQLARLRVGSVSSQSAWGINSGTERKRLAWREPRFAMASVRGGMGEGLTKRTYKISIMAWIICWPFVVIEHLVTRWPPTKDIARPSYKARRHQMHQLTHEHHLA
jgi:hypothetical protein